MILKIQTKEYGLAVIREVEYTNGRKALQLIGYHDGSAIAILTVNLPEHRLEDGEFFVKTWSENEQIVKDCLNSGLFIDTGKRVSTGYVQASVWRMT